MDALFWHAVYGVPRPVRLQLENCDESYRSGVEPSSDGAVQCFGGKHREALTLLEQREQFVAIRAAHRQLLTVSEDDDLIAIEERLHLSDTINVDERRAMDADEFLGIEPCLQLAHALADEM